jgi:hypothetical protein
MSDENSSVVSIVGIIAILILVGFAIYFFMMRSGGDADIEIDITGAVTEVVPDQQPPMSAGLSVVSFPG